MGGAHVDQTHEDPALGVPDDQQQISNYETCWALKTIRQMERMVQESAIFDGAEGKL